MKQRGNVLVILIILATLALGMVIYYKSKPTTIPSTPSNIYKLSSSTPQPISTSSTEQTKTFQSKNLKFSVTIPSNSGVREKNTYVDITIAGSVIDFVRNGTNFDSLQSYMKDYDLKKKVQVTDSKSLTINGYQAMNRIEKNIGSGTRQRVYYIYADNWIYAISTTSDSLFDDLDHIAQSFRYIP